MPDSKTGSLLPALAIGVGAYLLYTKADDLSGSLSGIGGSGSSFYESIKETVKETVKETAGGDEDPESAWNIIFNPEKKPAAENAEIYQDNPDPETRTATGTAGEWAGFLTKGPVGAAFNVISEIGTAINPMPEDLKAQQQLLGSGNFTAQDAADPNSLFAKLFGGASKSSGGASKSSYASKAGEVHSVNVSDIKTHEQAVSMGLGLAPLAVNANPKIDKKAVINKSTNKSLTAKQLKASGMPATNLKNAVSATVSTDKSGKERIHIKYDGKNGVKGLRY